VSEIVERVSLAILEAVEYSVPPYLCEQAARAAFEAMRKPTHDMLMALSVSPDMGDGGHIIRYSVDKLPAAFDAMIDAALE
jgi:hypothetical protein